jgi:hypothetical protein
MLIPSFGLRITDAKNNEKVQQTSTTGFPWFGQLKAPSGQTFDSRGTAPAVLGPNRRRRPIPKKGMGILRRGSPPAFPPAEASRPSASIQRVISDKTLPSVNRSSRFDRLARTLMMMPRRFVPRSVLLVRDVVKQAALAVSARGCHWRCPP